MGWINFFLNVIHRFSVTCTEGVLVKDNWSLNPLYTNTTVQNHIERLLWLTSRINVSGARCKSNNLALNLFLLSLHNNLARINISTRYFDIFASNNNFKTVWKFDLWETVETGWIAWCSAYLTERAPLHHHSTATTCKVQDQTRL